MKTYLCFFLILMLLLTGCARLHHVTARAPANAAKEIREGQPSLLADGAFEEASAGGGSAKWRNVNVDWVPGQHEGPKTKPVIDSDVKRSGKSSLRIDHVEETQYTYVWQTVRSKGVSVVKPNTDYVYTGYFRVKDITGEGLGVKLYVCKTDYHVGFALSEEPDYRREEEWQELQVHFNTGDHEIVHCGFIFKRRKGTVWVDDLRLEEVAPPPAQR